MVDTLVLGTSAARREGSSPFIRTIMTLLNIMNKPFSLVIWDLDGTILDSLEISIEVWQKVLPMHRLPRPTSQDVMHNYHGTLEDTARALAGDIPESELASILADFMLLDDEYIQDVDHYIFPDALALAQRLHNAGKRQVVLTNRAHGQDRKNASPRNIIENSKLGPYIDQIVCGDEVVERKPSPQALTGIISEADQLLIIGDQYVDALFAHNLESNAYLVQRSDETILHLDRLPDGWESHVKIVRSLADIMT